MPSEKEQVALSTIAASGGLTLAKGIVELHGGRIEAISAGSVASFKAKASYSSTLRVTSSGRPTALSKLAATRPTKLSPMHVSTGSPTQSASLHVVCAL